MENTHRPSDATLRYILTRNYKFVEAEEELKKAAGKLVDLQIQLHNHFNLTPAESNRLLEFMTSRTKELLFTDTHIGQGI